METYQVNLLQFFVTQTKKNYLALNCKTNNLFKIKKFREEH